MPKYSGSCGCYNREMARQFGVITAIIYNDLEDKYDYYGREGELQDGYFYLSQTNRADALAIPRKSYGQGLAKLEEAGLIKKKIGYKPNTTTKATWVTLTQEDERAAFSLGENDQSRLGENDQSIYNDTNNETELAESVAETTTDDSHMLPSALYARLRSFFPGEKNDMRKKKVEAVEKLQNDFELSDETILDGVKEISKHPTYKFDDGREFTESLASLLFGDLEKTASKIIKKAEAARGREEKKNKESSRRQSILNAGVC